MQIIVFLLILCIISVYSFNPYSFRSSRLSTSSFLNMEMDFNELKDDTNDRMSKSMESYVSQMNTIRTGGANPNILDRIQVEYYGTYTPLQQVARVAAQGSDMLVIEPFDKAIIKDIEREISQSELNLTPTNDGSGVIRISIPPMTEDRRKQLVKQAKSVSEDGKVAIRNIRRDAVDAIKKAEKASDLSKDDSAGAQAIIQEMTDNFIKKLDELLKSKETALMKV